MKKLSKEFLGLSGEYSVASELCKRGIYAQLTMGHHKRTDILVETDYKMLRIQVKAKQGREWPGVSGVFRENDLLVLIDFEKKKFKDRPDFYVIGVEDWKKLVSEEKKRYKEIKIDEELCIRYPDGWKGLNIKSSQVNDCLEAWHKIIDKVQK
ncbi:MAG: hypothetical protein KJ593_07340 [Candidatus Omnitrophica bacterium]|nr:hypothetical protein [Candidatus Omnitrophota bacterium]